MAAPIPEPIVVEVRRNGTVEARHRVHAVAVRGGEIVASAGDPKLVCFMRSSSKPLQALPLVRARDDLADDEIAIACASHNDTADQVDAARTLLAHARATEDDLELGLQEGRPPQKIHHNCSGKHAGMLALCDTQGWEKRGYHLPEHPVQLGCRAAHVEATDAEPLDAAADGCGVVTFAFPLWRMAHAYARLESLPGGDRIGAAMRARPDLVGGPDGVDFRLMRDAPGWLAKGGAEGLLCAAGPDGLGVAIKSEDGYSRPHAPALAAFLGPLGVSLESLAEIPLLNSRGERVGVIATATAAQVGAA
ncbi:MAG TPA: asparaginase [Gaiellaceae bacterium]